MKFEELPLYIAAFRVYEATEKPGSESWVGENVKDLYLNVLSVLVTEYGYEDGLPSLEDVRSAWRNMRKVPKARITAEIAPRHGCKCFYEGRVTGECSEDIDLDRILPDSRGGKYVANNCVLSCSFHNRSRGDKSIEDFIAHQNTKPAEPESK